MKNVIRCALAVAAATLACSGDEPSAPSHAPRSPDSHAEARPPKPPAPAQGAPKDLRDVARAYANDVARRPVETDWTGGDAANGQKLYLQHCALCHGPAGSGEGTASVALNPKPRDFRDGTFYIDGNANGETGEDVDVARVILEGPGAFGGSDAMVGWKDAFTKDEVRDLVAHIRTLER